MERNELQSELQKREARVEAESDAGGSTHEGRTVAEAQLERALLQVGMRGESGGRRGEERVVGGERVVGDEREWWQESGGRRREERVVGGDRVVAGE
eukprot:3320772-Prymnesium_polylepis.1